MHNYNFAKEHPVLHKLSVLLSVINVL